MMSVEETGGDDGQDGLNASFRGVSGKQIDTMNNKTSESIVVSEATGSTDPLHRSSPNDMQLFIGRQLRAVYDDVAKQPIPDRFLELMKQLEAKTSGS